MPLPSASRLGSSAIPTPGQLPAARSASSADDSRELQAAIEASLTQQGYGQGTSSGGGAGGGLAAASPPVGGAGGAWAHLVKMGFAATGPTLGSSPPSSSFSSSAVAPGAGAGPRAGQATGGLVVLSSPHALPQPTGAWANKGGAIASAAAAGAGAAAKSASAAAVPVAAAWGARAGAGAAAGRPGPSGAAQPSAGEAGGEAGGKGKAKKGTLLFTTAQRRY